MEDENKSEVDALCPECGHAFKTHMDRVIENNDTARKDKNIECPVCGCGECKVGR